MDRKWTGMTVVLGMLMLIAGSWINTACSRKKADGMITLVFVDEKETLSDEFSVMDRALSKLMFEFYHQMFIDELNQLLPASNIKDPARITIMLPKREKKGDQENIIVSFERGGEKRIIYTINLDAKPDLGKEAKISAQAVMDALDSPALPHEQKTAPVKPGAIASARAGPPGLALSLFMIFLKPRIRCCRREYRF